MIGRELKLFFIALSFYTRIPVPASIHKDNARYLPDAIRYLPVVGWVVGAITTAVYGAANYLFDPAVATVLSMIAGMLITGAFHEDGFADVCDGFGGGWTKERILEIMKDSRLGTYGVVGLVLILGLKFTALQLLLSAAFVHADMLEILLLLVLAHALSRFAAITVIFNYSYARISESKASGAVEKGGVKNLMFAALFTLLPLIALMLVSSNFIFALIILPVLIVSIAAGNYFKKWIGGYTGDCLGTVQQITEVIIYLCYILIWKFI